MTTIIKWMHSVCGYTGVPSYSDYDQNTIFPDKAVAAWEEYQKRQMPIRFAAMTRHCTGRTKNVLDVGAGSGLFTRYAFLRSCRVDVVEPCSITAQRLKGVANHVFASMDDDICDGTWQWDMVHCNGVIEHVPDPRSFSMSLFRRTRPGGVCWVMTCNELGLLILCTIFRLLTFRRVSVAHYIYRWHINYWDKEHVERLLTSAGFFIAESWTEPWQQPPRWSLRRVIHWAIRLHSICIVAKRP